MIISGLEKELGAKFEARRIEDNSLVYGITVIIVDSEKSYLIQRFETNEGVDCSPALAYYAVVKTSSIKFLEEDEDISCENCGECKCFSCRYREGGMGEVDCIGRCNDCGDIPIEKCEDFKYSDW